ncbi:MAG: TIGR03960 family B12-binding radical SAM protein [Patescibacteria group bacterium]
MAPGLFERVDEILPAVQKPTRYVGGEWNAPRRPWDGARLHVALAYPDVYEVGQSNLGLQILYGLINETPGALAERVYAPWPDMQAAMERAGIPLFSLESRRPIRDFELLGFSLQYELTYTNILRMLALADLPLRARSRRAPLPLVIGGGPGAYNPEPLADFFDLFFLGEAEQGLPEMLRVLLEEDTRDRARVLRRLAGIEGVYVPGLYGISYHADGRVAEIRPQPGAPSIVKKRLVKDLEGAYSPSCFVVPNQEIVHDRAMLEIMRGCSHGCRFCQAGMVYRPVRHRPAAELAGRADAVLASTGFEELSLASLSSTDHPEIEALAGELQNRHGGRGVNVTLPSLRADRFSLSLAQRLQGNRKTSLTFAPEAGSERLRRVINKDLSEDDILGTAEAAFAAGWQRLKLYFMLGLPTETGEDLESMALLARRVLAVGRRHTARAVVAVSVSTFVPKPHTPFQWRPQLDLQLIKERQHLLQNLVRGRGLELQWHQAEQSLLEGVIARGDRRLACALERAMQLGCGFDGWTEWFDFSLWQKALQECGLDAHFYACRTRSYDEVLPWDHLSAGIGKAFLIAEDRRAQNGEPTPDCRRGACGGCGVCQAYAIREDGARA